ncbi:MAG: hypothetical protein C0436_05005 [Alphaproteobacteria bacterium]|nr:hypothetical protein [Alphaproteobacteria bacterium]
MRSVERQYSNFVQNEIDRAGVTSREDAQAITRALAATSPTSEELLNRERANQQLSSGRER